MENVKISTTPLAHSNNNNSTGISTTNTTKGCSTIQSAPTLSKNMLNLDIDVAKQFESSVDVQRPVPLRSNFKKSNTCGSFFAKCKCNNHPHHYQTVIPLITASDCEKQLHSSKLERNSRKTQSFSHPDTPIVFTEQNRYPATSAGDLIGNRLRSSLETIIKTRDQKIEIKHSKRASSPEPVCNGNGIDIHPEFQVQVKPKSPLNQDQLDNSVPRHPILKKSSKSFPFPYQRTSSFRSLSDRPFSSSYSVDEANEEIELSGKVSDLLVNEKKSSPTNTIEVDVHSDENHVLNGSSVENNLNSINNSLKVQPNEKDFIQVSDWKDLRKWYGSLVELCTGKWQLRF